MIRAAGRLGDLVDPITQARVEPRDDPVVGRGPDCQHGQELGGGEDVVGMRRVAPVEVLLDDELSSAGDQQAQHG